MRNTAIMVVTKFIVHDLVSRKIAHHSGILHTVEKCSEVRPRVAVFTLGTNHVYILKETGEIVDNCQKRPQRLFEERIGLTVMITFRVPSLPSDAAVCDFSRLIAFCR